MANFVFGGGSGSMRLSLPPSEPAVPDTGGVATFISKVWKILEKTEYNSLISWSDSGKTFLVHDYSHFAKEILPLYFKHSNFNSFVRQLNLYGFRKVTKPDQGSLANTQTNEPVEFWHTNFRKGHPELLNLVQRRSVANRTGTDEKNPQLTKVICDIHQMKGRQENIATILDAMKQDNQHLRHELSLLKERHIRQQRVLNKIIQFLVHMVYKGKLPSGRRRSARLMLMDAESQPSPPKRMRTYSEGSTTDVPDITSAYSVQSPLTSVTQSPPLIQSVQFFQSPPASPEQTAALDLPVITDMFTTSSTSTAPTFTLPVTSTTGTWPSEANLPPLDPDSGSSLQLPSELLGTELPVSPPQPTLLVANPPRDRMSITGHLDHQQQGIDSLPDLLSGQFSLDPSIISEFISTEHLPCPEYDFIDTARLLESLASNDPINVDHESSLRPNKALIPISQSSVPAPLMIPQQQPIVEEAISPTLRELLENEGD